MEGRGMAAAEALAGGLAGALALTLIHETARRTVPGAPRMDTLGRRSLRKGLKGLGLEPPPRDQQQGLALAGDLVANTLYYALAGLGPARRPVLRGAVLGAAAGLGAVALPPVMGLGRRPRGLTLPTQAMTFGLYLAGGLVAGVVSQALISRNRLPGPQARPPGSTGGGGPAPGSA